MIEAGCGAHEKRDGIRALDPDGVADELVEVAKAVGALQRFAVHVIEMRVTAGDDQSDERELDARERALLRGFEQHGVDVAFEMVDAEERLAERPRHGFGVAHADEQRADQVRPLGDGDGVEVGVGDVGLFAGFAHHGDDFFQVGARGELRDNAAILGVEVDLRADDVGEDARAVGHHRGGGFVAARFNGEDAGHDSSHGST